MCSFCSLLGDTGILAGVDFLAEPAQPGMPACPPPQVNGKPPPHRNAPGAPRATRPNRTGMEALAASLRYDRVEEGVIL
jgi:hypothetical protein